MITLITTGTMFFLFLLTLFQYCAFLVIAWIAVRLLVPPLKATYYAIKAMIEFK